MSGHAHRLDGRVALVTGASSGLGARFASVLHAAGAQVVITARRQHRLRQLAEDLGPRIAFVAGDLRAPEVRSAVVDLAADRFGRLDILVNNAGACDAGPLQALIPGGCNVTATAYPILCQSRAGPCGQAQQ